MNAQVATPGNSGTYDAKTLIKFNNLDTLLPAGAYVQKAVLELTWEVWTVGPDITGYFVNTPWNPTASKLGWKYRDETLTWNSVGCAGQGTDVVSGVSFKFGNFMDSGIQMKATQLDRDLVQQWFRNPASNNGVLLTNSQPIRALNYHGLHAVPAYRPRLTITYSMDKPDAAARPVVYPEIPKEIFVAVNNGNCQLSPTCGNDTIGTGSIFTPFATIYKALVEANAGDIITLRSGVHAGGVSITRPNITIRSMEGEYATIAAPNNDPTKQITVYLRVDSSYSKLQRLEIIGGFAYAIKIESTYV